MSLSSIFARMHEMAPSRTITFKRAVLSGGVVTYAADVQLKVSIRYRDVGFDFERGVLYHQSRVEALIWFRDWFGRSTDGATAAELQDLVSKLKGDVKEGDPEHYSRFEVDGASLKYDSHQFDERPDGTLFAVLVVFQAA